MASTAIGRTLTEQHRRAQLTVRARSLAQTLALWQLFDLRDIDRSWAAMQPALVAITVNGYQQSARMAATYYSAFRAVEGVPGAFTVPLLQGPPATFTASVATSLRVTGPVRAKTLITSNAVQARGVEAVRNQIIADLGGAMGRHVLNGGREQVREAVRADRRALGYARVTRDDACAFCALLASRGPVYSADTVKFESHDNCACSGEPVFSRDQPWPGRAGEWADLYGDIAKGEEDPLNAFRRAYEGRTASING